MLRFAILLGVAMGVLLAYGDITVSDVQVFSGYPWKEVVVGYTITGTDAEAETIRLTATDKTANETYVVETPSSSLTGAELSEGRHVLRWAAATDGVKITSTNVIFTVSVITYDSVQLWENGPSWAECNVGAMNPADYGYYFWWGDTVGYKRNASNNGWVSVKTGSSFTFISENCPTAGKSGSWLKSEGYILSTDGCLVAKYDAATAHLGAPWRMPTEAEWSALISNCTLEWTTRNGVYGWLVTGKGDYVTKSIFLPATGNGYNLNNSERGTGCRYWSSKPIVTSSINSEYPYAKAFVGSSQYNSNGSVISNYRYLGFPVRPVKPSAQ